MADINAFEPLRALPDAVLKEIVREGELRIQAQLATATAADQRALTLAGFQIASASAALAGGGALIVSDKPNLPLALLAMVFAIAMITATVLAIRTVRPAKFDLPGNCPSGWLPENWMGAGLHPPTLKQARIEQAACLDSSIADNVRCAEIAAKSIHRSLDVTLWTVTLAAIGMLMILMAEHRETGCHSTSIPYSWMPACIAQDGGPKNAPTPSAHPLTINIIDRAFPAGSKQAERSLRHKRKPRPAMQHEKRAAR